MHVELLTIYKCRAIGYRFDYRMDVAAESMADAQAKMQAWLERQQPAHARSAEYRAVRSQRNGLPVAVIV
jgi:hypothetical protein